MGLLNFLGCISVFLGKQMVENEFFKVKNHEPQLSTLKVISSG
jgi:hypothetical protein